MFGSSIATTTAETFVDSLTSQSVQGLLYIWTHYWPLIMVIVAIGFGIALAKKIFFIR